MSSKDGEEVRAMNEASLHAYVDGQLGAYEAAEVAQWLLEHPQDAQRVLEWRSQRAALQGLHAQLLDEPLPARLLLALQTGQRPAANSPRYRFQALAGVALLGLGLALGWGSHAWLAAERGAPVAAAAPVPPFVRDAAIAHAVYLPERRHPVEVGAEQQEHLVQWLSKRLGQPLHVPVLLNEGYRLIGGRLLPAGEDEGAGAPLARAQFMFETEQGQRLTLYVSVVPPAQAVPTAFRFSESADKSGDRSFYWVDGRLGYALTGRLSPQQLSHLGSRVYEQLQPGR